mmetsp:Transcript_25978/g.36617  ORF Transcript_25978/g.36617 Transcript_25978/m.36617 type:complete len:175 (+) Transcript_25978:35-559(+)
MSSFPAERRNATLAGFVPEKNPPFWIVVNGLCLLFSVVLLVLILIAEEESRGKKFAKRCYLLYDFVTTLVWCVEVGLIVWYHGNASSWERRIELLLASYFVPESSYALYRSKVKKQDLNTIFLTVVLSLLAYLYVLVETIKKYARRNDFVQLQESAELLLAEESAEATSAADTK